MAQSPQKYQYPFNPSSLISSDTSDESHPCETLGSWDSRDNDDDFLQEIATKNNSQCFSTKGTIPGAIVNLSNVAIGGGLLTFPYVFHQTGIGSGLFLVFLLAIILYILGEMLAIVCNKVHLQAPSVYLTYETITDLVLGRKLTIFIIFCVIIAIFSAQIASLIIMGDMLEPIIKEYGKHSDEWWASRAMITIILAICMFPLCCLKKIDNLRWTSAIAMISLTLVTIIVCLFTIDYFHNGHYSDFVDNDARGEIVWFRFSIDVFVAIPIITYSMAFHIQIPPVYQELNKKSGEKLFPTTLCNKKRILFFTKIKNSHYNIVK